MQMWDAPSGADGHARAQVGTVAWSVTPDAKANTRPVRLITELRRLGLVANEAVYVHHGRARSVDLTHVRSRSMWFPTVGSELLENVAYLSPVYVRRAAAIWQDLYDDWSIAPDINHFYRVLSWLNYRKIASGRARAQCTITVNTPYMAKKLGLPVDYVVPNGVDTDLANQVRSGDDRRRLILLGHFFEGRTDWRLMENIVEAGGFEEILIGSPGRSTQMARLIENWRKRGIRTDVRDWIDAPEVSAHIGDRTIAAVPHVVTPYTRSQDLMKIYQFGALGVPVICPRELWPEGLDTSFGLLLNQCENVGSNFGEASGLTDAWRKSFAVDNSWESRAVMIRNRIVG